MRIELTEEQAAVRRTIRDFAAAEIRPHAARWDREGSFPKEVVPELAVLGLLGLVVPEEYGGSGLEMVSAMLAVEAVSWGDGSLGLTVASHNSLCVGHILAFAGGEQKGHYMPLLAGGDAL